MTDKDALARTLALESAVLDELREVHADTREAARAVMRKGDRLVIWDGEGDEAVALGDVSVTNPKVSCRIQDWGLFTAWAMKNAPEFVHEVTVLKVSQRLVDKVCNGEGEYIDANGVVHLPDGVGTSSATPQLRVKITDAGREKARQMLAWMPREVES